MPNYRVTFFFESEQSADIGAGSSLGWTESWYKTIGTSDLEVVLGDPDIARYITFRRQSMPDIYRMSFVRVSDEDNPRRFKIATIIAGNGIIGAAASAPAQVQCSILVDLEKLPDPARPTEKVHHRRFLMRALPAAIINGNVLDTANANFIPIRRFLDFVGNKVAGDVHPGGLPRFTWGVKFLDPTITVVTIEDMQVDPVSNLQVAIRPVVAVGVNRGQKFIVSGVDSPPEFNRTWTYIADKLIGVPSFSIFGTSRRKLQGVYAGPGRATIKPAKYLYGPVDQYVIIGLRNKKTGRAFRQLRGRSSSRP